MRSESLACLIIDDPLLRPRYGCLDYAKLLEKMKIHHFFTEIAFIPYNYKRSYPETVRLFANNPEYFSICIHGCDHTGNEFGGSNHKLLTDLAAIALWRMEQHKRLTGLPYDPVIVFPQGRFSSTAMMALKDIGIFAAFNSTIQAVDGKEPAPTEYQKPATLIYHGVPLFLRRYPREKTYIAEDLALGRPIIIVEHHHAFRDGYDAITRSVDWINSLGNIRWTSLLNIAEHYLGKKYSNISADTQVYQAPNKISAKASLRRVVSEIRDNYIETNAVLSRFYSMLRG